MAVSATVKDIYSEKFNAVFENDSASKCLESFKKDMPPVLAVLDEKGNYVGMVSRRSVIRSRLDLTRLKVKNLMTGASKVSLDDSLSRVAKLMIGSGVRQLPVIEQNKIIGFVTDEDLIHAFAEAPWGNAPVESLMTRAPHTVEVNRSVGAVLGLMREFGISHVPIMERGRLGGIISIQDIFDNLYFPPKRMGNNDFAGDRIATLGISAKAIMRRPVITVDPKKAIHDCEALMHYHDISCLCIVDGERLIGVVTKLDFLEPISQLETAEHRLTIQFSIKDIEINPEIQQFMMAEFDSFARRFQDAFQPGSLFVYMKTHRGTNMRDTPMVHCRLQFRTTKGSFIAAGEGWGVEPTFNVALDRLERRLLRSKELLAYNPRFARDYLRKIGLPSEEE
ncbi:CBS domain-containing protein [Candidatus Bathycorpusculum sp.]|uniref:CBS domain-containing protein n=1 Tax=Candidatus Bathycorpusculum sp. TaxID=2994959 RepID=UPI00281E959A|nr:CBS domain-containing protein [Candidatus Termitimicrobium sp.]MCL2431324.1 CBS domain-containing protein [Candidatus Termitimicrobium sp.]